MTAGFKHFRFFLITTLLGLSSLYADDDDLRIAVQMPGSCPLVLQEALQIIDPSSELTSTPKINPTPSSRQGLLHKLVGFFWGNPSARTSATIVAGSFPYQSKPEAGIRVHYVQSFPGKAKFLRNRLTAEEVNILLNQIRSFLLAENLVGGDRELLYDFKSMRYNQLAENEDPAEMKAALQSAESRFRQLQASFLENSLSHIWADTRLVAVGSGATEMQATIAPRFSTEHFVRFEDVRDIIEASLKDLDKVSEDLFQALFSNPLWHKYAADDGLSLAFFKMMRKIQSPSEIEKILFALDPDSSLEQREKVSQMAISFLSLLDKFVPGTQYDSSSLDRVDAETGPRDRGHPDGTKSLLVADVKGAGADILRETWRSIELSLTVHPFAELEFILEQIDIQPAIERLVSSLQLAVDTVRRIEGDRIIEVWATGDELIFSLKDEAQIHNFPLPTNVPFRVAEAQLPGFEALNRLEQAFLRELGEKAQQVLEDSYLGMSVSSVRVFAQSGSPKIQVFIRNDIFESERYSVERQLVVDLQRLFSEFRALQNLEIEILSFMDS